MSKNTKNSAKTTKNSRKPSAKTPGRAAGTKAKQASNAANADEATTKQRGRFSALSVRELQAKYLEVVGRETGSADRAYLVWKLREAENGRIPLGPRTVHAAADMTTLPFRIPTASIEAMDEIWRARGVRSRNRFLQDAVGHYLTHLDEPAAAEQFMTTQPAVTVS